jgi:hypothetical protein
MAINYFAVLTDGFEKPADTDWTTKLSRALLITDGYLNKETSGPIVIIKIKRGLLLGVY